jgi:hypothetical protein
MRKPRLFSCLSLIVFVFRVRSEDRNTTASTRQPLKAVDIPPSTQGENTNIDRSGVGVASPNAKLFHPDHGI